ncbi:MAG: hypothetical protein FWD15_06105 [Alphaproteobacteria bacterium]|nr:hypothetical protein [Alphaproteobacteria bacterium]
MKKRGHSEKDARKLGKRLTVKPQKIKTWSKPSDGKSVFEDIRWKVYGAMILAGLVGILLGVFETRNNFEGIRLTADDKARLAEYFNHVIKSSGFHDKPK